MQRSQYIKIDDNVLSKEFAEEDKGSDFKLVDKDIYHEMSNTGYKRDMKKQKPPPAVNLKYMDP